MSNQEFVQYDHFKDHILKTSLELGAAGYLLQEKDTFIPHEEPFEHEGAPDDDEVGD
jgi:hypothetical protein